MRLLHFILSHSLFVALCAVALCFQTVQILHINISYWFYAFVFCATLCSYNFYYLVSGYVFGGRKIENLLTKQLTQVLFFCAAFAGTAISFFNLQFVGYSMLIAGALTFVYTIPLLPIKQLKVLQTVGFTKTLLLAFSWAYITVFLPYTQNCLFNVVAMKLLFCVRFVYLLLLCIIFDDRDIEVDKIKGLHSLATMVTPKTLQKIMLSLFVLYFLLVIVFGWHTKNILQPLMLSVAGIAAAAVYQLSKNKRSYLFYYFVVDGLMLLTALLTFIVAI
jgi:4-hydroxybenzoate polyprenyltransferase